MSIDIQYVIGEDATRTKSAAASITEGQPVALNSAGELIGATSGTGVYGLAKNDANEYHDFSFGEFGAYGTGKIAVVTSGVVRVKDSQYSGIEVDSSTVSSTDEHIHLLDSSVFAVNDKVYLTAAGLISKNVLGDAFGKVTATSAMTSGWLEIELNTALSATGAQGAIGATGATGAVGHTGATGHTGASA